MCGSFSDTPTPAFSMPLPAHVVVRFLEIPQAQRPPAHECRVGDERPVFFSDRVPQFGREARGRNWARVPARGRLFEVAVAVPLVFLRQFPPALVERVPAI